MRTLVVTLVGVTNLQSHTQFTLLIRSVRKQMRTTAYVESSNADANASLSFERQTNVHITIIAESADEHTNLHPRAYATPQNIRGVESSRMRSRCMRLQQGRRRRCRCRRRVVSSDISASLRIVGIGRVCWLLFGWCVLRDVSS